MNKGPFLNKIKRNFTTRDSLGIESVAASMSADLCPVINTVTPRAFYWPFMVWCYYDFYKYSGIKNKNKTEFNNYLKRQDYFFVMAALLNDDADQMYLAGVTQSEKDLDQSKGPYPYNPNYLKVTYGGMQYYHAGCLSMKFITEEDDEGNAFSFPKLTKLGEKLALSFESVIKDTEYYKKYRLSDKSVPRKVLKEYGKVIDFGLKGFGECKLILRDRLFANNPNLKDCAEYIKYLYDKYGVTEFDTYTCRQVFFDHISPDEEEIEITDSLKPISDGWEIVVGRQYFTSGLEMLWRPMLEMIQSPKTKAEWISSMFSNYEFTWDINRKLGDVIPECIYDFETREDMVYDASKDINWQASVENGIKIILSVYNWIKKRTDLGEERSLLYYGEDNQSIALTELVEKVEEYKDRSIKDFIVFIMSEWLIDQHYYTAFEKMIQKRDGFYFEIVDGLYHGRGYEFYIGFQGIRMVQLMQVMKDLDVL